MVRHPRESRSRQLDPLRAGARAKYQHARLTSANTVACSVALMRDDPRSSSCLGPWGKVLAPTFRQDKRKNEPSTGSQQANLLRMRCVDKIGYPEM